MAEKVNSAKKGFPKAWGITLILVIATAVAAIIILHHNPLANPQEEMVKKIIACAIILVAVLGLTILYDKIMILPQELWQNRQLIWKLAKNDFKTRYAGSTMGRVWAFVQPVVTVVMYYFVFGLIFPARAQLVASGMFHGIMRTEQALSIQTTTAESGCSMWTE